MERAASFPGFSPGKLGEIKGTGEVLFPNSPRRVLQVSDVCSPLTFIKGQIGALSFRMEILVVPVGILPFPVFTEMTAISLNHLLHHIRTMLLLKENQSDQRTYALENAI